jgi:hypothetical protein
MKSKYNSDSPTFNSEILNKMRIEMDMTVAQIASYFGCSKSGIEKKLTEYEIRKIHRNVTVRKVVNETVVISRAQQISQQFLQVRL